MKNNNPDCPDKERFEKVFLNYYPKVKAYIRKFIGIESEAEDMAQDIFVKLWTQKDLLDDIVFVDGYLYRMAKNAVYNYVKHKYVTQAYIDKCMESKQVQEDGYEWIYAREVKERINSAVAAMPQQRKKIFLMSRKEGLSNKEIAEKLDISKRTVDNHMAIALAELKKIIGFFIFFI